MLALPWYEGEEGGGGREPSENNKTNTPRLGRVMSASPVVVSFVKNMSIISLLLQRIITNIINRGPWAVGTVGCYQTNIMYHQLEKLSF